MKLRYFRFCKEEAYEVGKDGVFSIEMEPLSERCYVLLGKRGVISLSIKDRDYGYVVEEDSSNEK